MTEPSIPSKIIKHMDSDNSSKKVVLYAMAANMIVAAVKYVVAFMTRSTAMMAEAVHSSADSLNQILLLVGIKKGRRAPDDQHPFGFSGESYFWSFIVAVILFTLGSVYTINEGIHKIQNPAPIQNVKYILIVLIVSMLLEAVAFYKALGKVNRDRGTMSVMKYLRKTKKSEIVVIFLEDLGAIIGLLVAFVCVTIQHYTNILWLDGVASVIIGVILGVIALFIGAEIKSLLIGEAADKKTIDEITNIISNEPGIEQLIHIRSLQLGPDDVLLTIKAEFNHRLTSVEISNIINGMEEEIRERFRDIKKIFIEPDIRRRRIV